VLVGLKRATIQPVELYLTRCSKRRDAEKSGVRSLKQSLSIIGELYA
jgi:hypothetical protein